MSVPAFLWPVLAPLPDQHEDPEQGDQQSGGPVDPGEDAGGKFTSEQGDGGAEEDPPEERTGGHACHEQDGGGEAAIGIGETGSSEYGREEQDAQRIGKGQEQCRQVHSQFSFRGKRCFRRAGLDPAEEDPRAQQAEDRGAEEAEQQAMFRQQPGNRRHAEGGEGTEGPVGRGHAQSREDAAQPSEGEGAPDTQQAHGPDRRGYGQADEQAFNEKQEGHKAQGSFT